MRGARSLAGEQGPFPEHLSPLRPAVASHLLLGSCPQGSRLPAGCLEEARSAAVSQGEWAPAPPCSHQLLFSSPRICFSFLHVYTLKMMFAPPHPFPLHSPPGRWISSAPWNRARNNKYLWVPGEGWTVNHHLSLCLLWKELALQNLH